MYCCCRLSIVVVAVTVAIAIVGRSPVVVVPDVGCWLLLLPVVGCCCRCNDQHQQHQQQQPTTATATDDMTSRITTVSFGRLFLDKLLLGNSQDTVSGLVIKSTTMSKDKQSNRFKTIVPETLIDHFTSLFLFTRLNQLKVNAIRLYKGLWFNREILD